VIALDFTGAIWGQADVGHVVGGRIRGLHRFLNPVVLFHILAISPMWEADEGTPTTAATPEGSALSGGVGSLRAVALCGFQVLESGSCIQGPLVPLATGGGRTVAEFFSTRC